MGPLSEPTVIVALITSLSAIVVAIVTNGIKRAAKRSDAEVEARAEAAAKSAESKADSTAQKVGGDMGDIVASAIKAAVDPVNERLFMVEGQLHIMRGELVPVAVADRGLVLQAVADGLMPHARVYMIPESVAPFYPPHLRTIPKPKEGTP